MLDFLTFHFQECRRKTATIKAYKSALEQPLRQGFNIQLHDDIFGDLIPAMALKAPAELTLNISWSLNKVLSLLTSQEFSGPEATECKLLAKAIFLTTVACGGHMSEISTLRRGKMHII